MSPAPPKRSLFPPNGTILSPLPAPIPTPPPRPRASSRDLHQAALASASAVDLMLATRNSPSFSASTALHASWSSDETNRHSNRRPQAIVVCEQPAPASKSPLAKIGNYWRNLREKRKEQKILAEAAAADEQERKMKLEEDAFVAKQHQIDAEKASQNIDSHGSMSFATPSINYAHRNSKTLQPLPPILTPALIHSIANTCLPRTLQFSTWSRLFSLARDGSDFKSFLAGAAKAARGGRSETLLVVQTMDGAIFGGLGTDIWAPQRTCPSNQYFGSGGSFLFKIDPHPAPIARSSSWTGDEPFSAASKGELAKCFSEECIVSERGFLAATPGTVSPYFWSGNNDYFQAVDIAAGCVRMGGGGGGGGGGGESGFSLSDDFSKATSGMCATFMNDALFEGGVCEVADVELWGFSNM